MYSSRRLEAFEEDDEDTQFSSRQRRGAPTEEERPSKRRRCADSESQEEDCDGEVEPDSPQDDLAVLSEEDEFLKSESESEITPPPTPPSPHRIARMMRNQDYLDLAMNLPDPKAPEFCDVIRFICTAFVAAVSGAGSAAPHPGSPSPSTSDGSPALPETPKDAVSSSHTVRYVSFKGTFTVVGDLHGDLESLHYILRQMGDLPSASHQLLFNGDYVDRGPCSLKVAMLVMALKAQYPEFVHLNRGNHEFMDEGLHQSHVNCNLRFDVGEHDEMEEVIVASLAHLPLVHVLEGEGSRRVVVAHAGLPMDGGRVATLDELARSSTGTQSLYHWQISPLEYSVLWNDPMEEAGTRPSPRGGMALLYGPDKTAEFLESNGVTLFVRSHQMVESGYQLSHSGTVATVMSTIDAEHGGSAAFLRFSSKDMSHEHFFFDLEDLDKFTKEEPELVC